MSGFLNNLVTKSFNPTASIRPRLLSRFEPLPGSAARVPPQMVEQHARAPGVADDGTAAMLNVAPNPVAHAAAHGSHAAPPAAAAPVAVAVPAPPVSGFQTPQASVPPDAQQTNEPRHDATVQTPAPVPEPPAAPAPLLIARMIERLTVERRVAPDQTPAAPDGTLMPPQPRLTALDAHAATRGDNLAPRSAAVDHTTTIIMREQSTDSAPSALALRPPEQIVERLLVAERPGAVLAQPQVTRRNEPARPSTTSAAPPPTPTIHVTIGRIEVRATQQTRPAAPTRQEPARLSLDDYLRQRSRGGGG